MLEESNFSNVVCRELNIATDKTPDLTEWKEMLERINNRSKKCKIALCGKYVALRRRIPSVAVGTSSRKVTKIRMMVRNQ